MTKLERILCPVDFSAASDLALEYALALGKEHGGQVSVMHVFPKVLADPEVYPYLSEAVATSDEARERAFHLMGGFVHRAIAQGTAAEVILEDGDVVDEVLERSQKLPADLVVMGTHGRRGFRRLLLGSVTERFLRQSPTPVLSIPPSAASPTGDRAIFQRILCPVDFSLASENALRLTRDIGGKGADVLVLHVIDLNLQPALEEGAPFDTSELEEQYRERARARLQALLAPGARDGTRLEIASVKVGGAHREILRIAEREKSELIVMGVAGRSTADLMFFGSTTNHVVRSAAAPVLTVRSPGGQE